MTALEQAVAAQRELRAAREELRRRRAVYIAAIVRANAQGLSTGAIGKELGISRSRVHQIVVADRRDQLAQAASQ